MSYDIRIRDLPRQPAAIVRGAVTVEAIPAFLGPAFDAVVRAAADQGLEVVGPPFGRFLPLPDGRWNIEAGFPLAGDLVETGPVEPSSLPAGPCACTVHDGGYDTVESAYIALTQWISEHGYATTGEPWECYLDAPDAPRPRTEVFMPVVRPDSN
ncbi:AraC family transcriptional regulator [Prescottella agglutinans]|uniref:AraC family transcriptional regulator n=1 Tax=Prescottella agglutinans TaxID=1644129 RepID=A0A3S3AI04_9NOCA|nr:GyrI-like domain-containing protein [Prescottella agglutinans]RVW08668.1 AraC family transcriptional regulator [Prescottella agglutinans]